MFQKLTRYERYILIFLACGLVAGSLMNFLKKKTMKDSFFAPKKILSANTSSSIEKTVKEYKTIDINTASKDDFEKLPGIGPSIASRIIEYRNLKGSFKDTSEILEVKGIGEKKFKAIKDFLIVK